MAKDLKQAKKNHTIVEKFIICATQVNDKIRKKIILNYTEVYDWK
jgi:hypothetical protein